MAHEWIPCDQILAAVQRARHEEEMIAQASWVQLQHALRSPTDAIVFQPTADEVVAAELEAALQAGQTVARYIQGDPSAEPPEEALVASHFALAGHTGALYLPSKKKGGGGQIGGQGPWHDQLRAIFQAHPVASAYLDALEAMIEKTVWGGKMDFLPRKMQADEYVAMIAMDYHGKGGAPLGENLLEFGKSIHDKREAMLERINQVRSGAGT